MNKQMIFGIFIGLFVLVTSSCRSEYEKLRTSTNTALVLRKANEYYEKEDWAKAQTLYELAIGAYKGRPEAEKAYFNYAYTNYHQEKYTLAAYYFRTFTNTFPNSQYREEADYMEHYSNFNLSPSYRLDQTYTQKAIDGFQLFINTYPTSPKVKEANSLITQMRTKLETKTYKEAELYYDLKQYQAATQSFQNLLKDFPDSPYAERVRYLIIKSNFNWAENSIFARQLDRYNNTIKYTENFLRKHPDSKYNKEIRNMVKTSYRQIKIISNVGH